VAGRKASYNTAIYVGCAGWSLRSEQKDRFDPGDSHLARLQSGE
jgi:hypothetical protein